MNTPDDILAYVIHQTEVLERRAQESVEFTSGGAIEDVWCESKEKACELWCYEFTRYAKENPGAVAWGLKPEIRQKKFFAKKSTNFLDTHILYCVFARFEIAATEQISEAG